MYSKLNYDRQAPRNGKNLCGSKLPTLIFSILYRKALTPITIGVCEESNFAYHPQIICSGSFLVKIIPWVPGLYSSTNKSMKYLIRGNSC